jgi:hypothetical protein
VERCKRCGITHSILYHKYNDDDRIREDRKQRIDQAIDNLQVITLHLNRAERVYLRDKLRDITHGRRSDEF